MRTRPCVRPLRFSFTEKSPYRFQKKFPLGLESGKISRTQLQLSEEWKVWRTQLQLTRGGRVEVRRLQKTDISSYQQKGTGAPQFSRWQISFLLPQESRYPGKTVARRLRGGRLYARRAVVCVPLTRQHPTAHLQWFREHHNWTEQDWACVLFSDESRFSLSSDCRRQLIWRESDTAYRPENIQKRTDIRHAVSWCGPAS
ncbi:transposable element Tcb2 transposase [Trichonephila clavipes]|nr:transposable element Tcb2 transposase [Trichonephila clavipes]